MLGSGDSGFRWMWGAITASGARFRYTFKSAPHRSGTLPHFKWNQCPTSTGIRTACSAARSAGRVPRAERTMARVPLITESISGLTLCSGLVCLSQRAGFSTNPEKSSIAPLISQESGFSNGELGASRNPQTGRRAVERVAVRQEDLVHPAGPERGEAPFGLSGHDCQRSVGYMQPRLKRSTPGRKKGLHVVCGAANLRGTWEDVRLRRASPGCAHRRERSRRSTSCAALWGEVVSVEQRHAFPGRRCRTLVAYQRWIECRRESQFRTTRQRLTFIKVGQC